MRTTLTLDDDVAALIQRLRKSRKLGLKQLVNEALRTGLRDMTNPPHQRRKKRYRTSVVRLGRCLTGNLDDIAEALAVAEGEDHA